MRNDTLDLTKKAFSDCFTGMVALLRETDKELLQLKEVKEMFSGKAVYEDTLKQRTAVQAFSELVPTHFDRYKEVQNVYREWY